MLLQRENIMTIPNIITASRLLLTPVIGYQILSTSYDAALALLVVAGASDWVSDLVSCLKLPAHCGDDTKSHKRCSTING